MGKATEYYIFQSPLTHIYVKSFKHSFLAHYNSNRIICHLNIKILKSTGMVPTMAMCIQSQRVAKKNGADSFIRIPSINKFLQEINYFKKDMCKCLAKVGNHKSLSCNLKIRQLANHFNFCLT